MERQAKRKRKRETDDDDVSKRRLDETGPRWEGTKEKGKKRDIARRWTRGEPDHKRTKRKGEYSRKEGRDRQRLEAVSFFRYDLREIHDRQKSGRGRVSNFEKSDRGIRSALTYRYLSRTSSFSCGMHKGYDRGILLAEDPFQGRRTFECSWALNRCVKRTFAQVRRQRVFSRFLVIERSENAKISRVQTQKVR